MKTVLLIIAFIGMAVMLGIVMYNIHIIRKEISSFEPHDYDDDDLI